MPQKVPWQDFALVPWHSYYGNWSRSSAEQLIADLLVPRHVCMYVNLIGHFPLGLFRTNINKQWQINIQMIITTLRILTGRRQTSWLFTSAGEKLNSGLPRTTSTSSQNEIWTRDRPTDLKSVALTTWPRCLQIEDNPPLTPAHSLCDYRFTTLPKLDQYKEDVDPSFIPSSAQAPWCGKQELSRRMKHYESLMTAFWTRWRKEYLLNLREFHGQPLKGHLARKDSSVNIGDVVFVMWIFREVDGGWLLWRNLSNEEMAGVVIIGPLHDSVTWYGINYTGTQVTQWDFQNKGTRTSQAQLSFVLKVPLRNLRPSVIYYVLCDRILQRAHSQVKLANGNRTQRPLQLQCVIIKRRNPKISSWLPI